MSNDHKLPVPPADRRCTNCTPENCAFKGGYGRCPSPAVAAEPECEGIRWQRVNSEPFEYAIQQGPCGDTFVKLFNGLCLRRAIPPVRGDREAIAKWLWEYLYSSKGFGFWTDVSEETRELWRSVASAFIAFLSLPVQSERWRPIDTCPKADYKSYYLFNELWEDDGWSSIQRANCFDEVWIFDSGLTLTDCNTKFNPVMWHPDTAPKPPALSRQAPHSSSETET